MTEIQDSWRKNKATTVKKKVTPEPEVQPETDNKVADTKQPANTVKGKMLEEFNTKTGGKTEAFVKEIIVNLAQEEEVDDPVEEVEQEVDPMLDLDQEEDGYCKEFLEKFLIGSESAFLDRIDIILMMRALPIPIMAKNRAKVSMFMFNILQASLIAFSTTGSV